LRRRLSPLARRTQTVWGVGGGNPASTVGPNARSSQLLPK
jgi:hypothetical protein